MDLKLEPSKSALVVIDLQKGVVGLSGAPHSASEVVSNAAALARAFRAQGGFVVLVRVSSHDGKDMVRPVTDPDAPGFRGPRQPGWDEIVPELGPEPGDLVVIKRQWGAFHGTELDLQLRRRGIETIVLCGIATGIGVDTTAREAYQHGYQQVFADDAMTGLTEAEHDYVCRCIFPRIGRVRPTSAILEALGAGVVTAGRG